MKITANFPTAMNIAPSFSQNKPMDTPMGGGVLINGKSAYEIAKENGFVGTEQEWLVSLKGKDGVDGKDGKNGIDGKDGRNGVDASHKWNGTTLTITSANGTSSANLKGDKGDTGDKGADGANGKNGYTPIKGVDYFDGLNGKDGKDGTNGKDGYTPVKGVDYFDGNDGFSPTVSLSKEGKVTTLEITDKNGTQKAEILDGADGQGGTGDCSVVQADWSENNPEAEGYVKNRTHYFVPSTYEPIVITKELLNSYAEEHIIVPDFIKAYKISNTLLPEEEILSSSLIFNGFKNENKFVIVDDPTFNSLGFMVYSALFAKSLEEQDIHEEYENFNIIVVPVDTNVPNLGIIKTGMYVQSNTVNDIFYHQSSLSITISNEYIQKIPSWFIDSKKSYECNIDRSISDICESPFRSTAIDNVVKRAIKGDNVSLVFTNGVRVYLHLIMDIGSLYYLHGIYHDLEGGGFKDTNVYISTRIDGTYQLYATKNITKTEIQIMINTAISNLPRYNGEVEEV